MSLTNRPKNFIIYEIKEIFCKGGDGKVSDNKFYYQHEGDEENNARGTEIEEYSEEKKTPLSEERYEDVFDKNHPKTLGFSLVALILSIVSVMTSFFGAPGVVLGCAGLGFALFSRSRLGYFDRLAISAIMAGIFGVVFGTVGMIVIHGPLGDILFGGR